MADDRFTLIPDLGLVVAGLYKGFMDANGVGGSETFLPTMAAGYTLFNTINILRTSPNIEFGEIMRYGIVAGVLLSSLELALSYAVGYSVTRILT